jgi:hypothetical protein
MLCMCTTLAGKRLIRQVHAAFFPAEDIDTTNKDTTIDFCTLFTMAPQPRPFEVYVRWRPLSASESSAPQIQRNIIANEANNSIKISTPSKTDQLRTWKSGPSFTDVFSESTNNRAVYQSVVAPTLPKVLQGATCNFFAYGHSGSGKTHTVIGYEYEVEQHLGLCFSAASDLFRSLAEINSSAEGTEELGVAVRLYEVRGKYAYDLFGDGAECHIREGADGRTHVRGATEILEGGKVRVRPITAVPCWSFRQLRSTVLAGLEKRKTGSSSVHEESSRTHAVLELEVVDKALLEVRSAVVERESELVPVGKRATDVYLEEQMASLVQKPDGGWAQNPDRPLNQARIDAAESEKREYENRLEAAEREVADYFARSRYPCLGGKFIFVDLAGSEYLKQGSSKATAQPKQTPQEQRQSQQINTDLFALKEVIRAKALNQRRIPFRSSPLTMVLRSHFEATNGGQSAMIVTVSPSETQFAATMNTLKYGNLVGEAGGNV